jgi:hypothetical protein
MKSVDIIQERFPDLRDDVEDWLWLDRNVPQAHPRIAETSQIVDWILRELNCDPDSMSQREKAQYLFEQTGCPDAIDFWSE